MGPPPPYDGLGPAVTEAEEPVATEAVPTESKLCPIQGTKILALRLSMVILGSVEQEQQGIIRASGHTICWNVLSHKRSTLVTLVSGFDARLKPTSPDHMIKRYKTIPLCMCDKTLFYCCHPLWWRLGEKYCAWLLSKVTSFASLPRWIVWAHCLHWITFTKNFLVPPVVSWAACRSNYAKHCRRSRNSWSPKRRCPMNFKRMHCTWSLRSRIIHLVDPQNCFNMFQWSPPFFLAISSTSQSGSARSRIIDNPGFGSEPSRSTSAGAVSGGQDKDSWEEKWPTNKTIQKHIVVQWFNIDMKEKSHDSIVVRKGRQ